MGIRATFNDKGSLGTFEYVQGDTLPRLKFTFIDEDTQEKIDLTGCTVVVRVRNKKTKKYQFTEELIIPVITQDQGIAILKWSEGRLDVSKGLYEGEISIEFADLSSETLYDTVQFNIRERFDE